MVLPPLFSVLLGVFRNFAACNAAARPETGSFVPPVPKLGIGGGGGGAGAPLVITGVGGGGAAGAAGAAGGAGGAAGGVGIEVIGGAGGAGGGWLLLLLGEVILGLEWTWCKL